ncbi:MAG: CBS domain-containing protein [Rhodanobacter sp.]|nr:MAG: CBS domain-containing protein [Rhodanobacter sp.]TAL97211.1 MAG: CBS domain-containing protein [Rhodanobacter sp.]TAM40980.1 MAG: CBS domain-containing protein [Rhodanobacter sp.]
MRNRPVREEVMKYRALALSPPTSPTVLPCSAPDQQKLALDAPALMAMTDFNYQCPVVVSPDRRIDDAQQDMIRSGVRALLVLEAECVRGLITLQDMLGERPILFLQSSACLQDRCDHHEVRVADIMTPVEQLLTLDLPIVQSARVGDVVETFKTSDHSHLVVTAACPDGASRVCGLISRTWLERQLDWTPDTDRPGETGTR